MNPVKLVIHDLDADNGGRFVVNESENELAAFRANLRSWIGDIRSGLSPPRDDRKGRASCDFFRLCETDGFWKR